MAIIRDLIGGKHRSRRWLRRAGILVSIGLIGVGVVYKTEAFADALIDPVKIGGSWISGIILVDDPAGQLKSPHRMERQAS